MTTPGPRDFPELGTAALSDFLTGQGIAHDITGPENRFRGVAQIGRCEAHHLVWSKKLDEAALTTPARVVLLPRQTEAERPDPGERTFFFVDNPRDAFRRILADLFRTQVEAAKGLHDPALFTGHPDGVWIARGTQIASDVRMGRDVIIHPGVTIYPGVTIGNNVEICADCVIGGPGFGHVRQDDGTLVPFPHLGGVQIGDDVSVGANTCIDSGGLSPTMVGKGVKIGNLTQIAHNVVIEQNVLVGTRCQVAGGTRIGEGTEIWAGVSIANNRVIGRNCDIKIGSIVISNLPDGAVVSGYFAIDHERNLEIYRGQRDH